MEEEEEEEDFRLVSTLTFQRSEIDINLRSSGR